MLLDHGFDGALAQRVVEMRYGPLGPSFRETLRRTFAGARRLYGFASVAPRSEYTAPMFADYLRATGDYARHLDQAEGRSDANRELLRAFHATTLTQAAGLDPSEPGASDRDALCALYDEGGTVLDRLRIARDVTSREDFLAFLPTLEVFLDRHPPRDLDTASRAVFADIQRLDPVRERVLGLVRDLNVSAVKLQLAHFSLQMGWMTPAEMRHVAVDSARQLLVRPLTTEIADVMCAITKQVNLADEFGADDLEPGIFGGAEGVRLVDCLHPRDERVGSHLTDALDGGDESLRVWAAYALSRRLPLNEPTLTRLARYVDDPLPDVRDRIRWVFHAQGGLPDAVLVAVRARDSALARELRTNEARGRVARARRPTPRAAR